MFRRHTARCLAFILMAVLAWPASAASAKSTRKPKPAGSVRFIDAPSSESAAARRARLRQECKGRPNAGMCLGLTR